MAAGKAVVPGVVSGEVTALVNGVLEGMSMGKIKFAGLAVLLLSGAVAAAFGRPSSGDPPADAAPARVVRPAREAAEDAGAPIAWGKAADGLQAGLGFRPGDRRTCSAGESVTL